MKSKMVRILLFSFILLVIVLGVFITTNKPNVNYALKTMNLTKINTEEFNSLTKKNEKSFIYIGRKTCPECLNLISKTNEVLKNAKKYGAIYYYDTDLARKDSNFEKFTDEVGITFVPTIIELENGKIKKQFSSEEINDYKKIINYFKETI
ncbi:thioredoxin family protein [Carnobacterium gallinarum]|uniref:thioredoxin family protein n=1 Tax=Carnobacterium gallinarum TaxID=2749 RepID=UPI0012FBC56D|nr:thioredoxin family protein [Carnobacterium gallinarum]